MIADFDDFVTWMYVPIDAIWQQLAPRSQRPGSQPACSDRERITMAVVAACRAWDKETKLIGAWHQYRHLFPVQPERSRFHRRRRHLWGAINHIRHMTLAVLDLAQDKQGVIDSLPLPVGQFHRVPSATDDWETQGATFGHGATKKQTIAGYRLQLLITLGGTIRDGALTSAEADERAAARAMRADKRELVVIGDKGLLRAPLATDLKARVHMRLRTLARRNQKAQLPPDARRLINHVRPIIATVHGQVTEQFPIETNHAHRFWGVCARLSTKLTAPTRCIALNRVLGNSEWLRIKSLAFPNSFLTSTRP